MPDNCQQIKSILAATAGTPTAKLIAVLLACGITSNKEIADLIGLKVRAIQTARATLNDATHCAQHSAYAAHGAAQHIAPNATHCAQQDALQKESFPPYPPSKKKTSSRVDSPSSITQSSVIARSTVDDCELLQLLGEAAGTALNPTSASLMMATTPRGWLANGADLEADILPTVRGMAAKATTHGVNSWEYFRGGVATAKANRERGLEAQPCAPAKPETDYQRRMRETREVLERMRAVNGTAEVSHV